MDNAARHGQGDCLTVAMERHEDRIAASVE